MLQYYGMTKKQVLLLISGIFLLTIIIGFFAYSQGKNNANESAKSSIQNHQEAQKYDLLAKRIFLEEPNENQINFSPLRKQINEYFEKNKLSGGNLYFEYLPTGTSIRISGDEQLVGASLMKVPAAMDLYKAAELGRLNIDEKIPLKQEWLNTSYGELYKKGAGYKLTLREATNIMLEQSDNTALQAVGNSTTGKLSLDELSLNFLDLDLRLNEDSTIGINSKGYSSVLKCLYFSCYNTKADSQTILNNLVNATYKNRIKSGISDPEIKVAHKIGTNFDENQNDCGIVYYPKNNYVICVMIPGPENSISDNHISNISKIIFDYFKSNS
jgi:beta-lactamase class A